MRNDEIDIGIIDYGMGNIQSVYNAFTRFNCTVKILTTPEEIAIPRALVLPGVGAFGKAMENLSELKLAPFLKKRILEEKTPLLGICLGMQLLADDSEERGHFKGLGLIPGSVKRITEKAGLRLPHIGWNDLHITKQEPFFHRASEGDAYYFVHSFHFTCDQEYIAATTDYSGPIVAAVQRKHIFGVQFHPERSHSKGLALLQNFVNYSCPNLQDKRNYA